MCSRGWKWYLALEQLLLPLLSTSIQGHSILKKTAMSGSNVSLQISESLPDYTHLTWLYTTKQKIVEWDLNETKYFDSAFKDKVMLDPKNAALHIYKVLKTDSGTYHLRLLTQSGIEQEWMIHLQVFDPVPKPRVQIEKREELDGNCHLNLSCVTQDQSVDYFWYRDSGPFPKEFQGSVLEVTVTPQNQSNFYTCQVSNPVSSNNDTVYFTPPCTLARSAGVTWTVSWLVGMVPAVAVLGLLFT